MPSGLYQGGALGQTAPANSPSGKNAGECMIGVTLASYVVVN